MKKSIVFDLDDTLCDFSYQLLLTVNEVYGKNIQMSDWNSYNIDEVLGFKVEQFFDMLRDCKVIEKCQPVTNARMVLEAVAPNYEINIVTARAWHDQGKEITTDWFAQHGLPYDNIIVCPPGHSKIEMITHLDNVHLAVDDRDIHCVEFHECPKINKALMIDKPWNRDVKDVHRIYDIKEVLNYI